MPSDSTKIVTFFVISDSTGETTTELVQATITRYLTVEFNLFRRTFVTDEKTLMQALQDALKEKALVLHTLISQELVEMTRSFYEEHQLLSFDMMTPPISGIEHLADIKPIWQPGALHLLNENYFKRIRAMGFAVKYDDRKDPRGFLGTDVVLLDVSQTPKTLLSLLLTNKNLRITSLLLISQAHIPKQLWEIDPKKTMGLTNNPDILSNIRKERMRPYGLNPGTTYSDIGKMRAELDFANDLYEKLGYVVINVTSLPIEETASLALNALDLGNHSYYGTETTEETD